MNTRFNPTANGALHLGHMFSAIVNAAAAHQGYGTYTVRFDDVSDTARAVGPDRLGLIIDGMIQDLTWMGIRVDKWTRQSHERAEIHSIIKEKFNFPLPQPTPPDLSNFQETPVLIGSTSIMFPYAPLLTIEKVIADWRDGITHVIRGMELMTEFSLYSYYCDQFDLPMPRHYYLPRLTCADGDVSKTRENFKISSMRASGYTPTDIDLILRKACLINPANGWELGNIKSVPVLPAIGAI